MKTQKALAADAASVSSQAAKFLVSGRPEEGA
jgi:hypothetical protein